MISHFLFQPKFIELYLLFQLRYFQILKVIESLVHALLANFYEQYSSNKVFMPKTRCDWVCLGNFSLFLSVQHRKLPPPLPPPTPTTATVKLASDWLGGGLELRSFCYWTSTKTGNQKIDKWLLSKYGTVQSAPCHHQKHL